MKPVRTGVVGVGIMGNIFAPILRESVLSELVAVADVDFARAETMAARLGVKPYKDIQQMLEKENVDAVAICTPEHLHLEPVRIAANARKHIFLEKPIAMTVEEGEKIVALTRSAGIKFMVGHCQRFDPRFVQGYESIRRGALGEIIHIRAWRESSIAMGLLCGPRTRLPYYLAVHDLDIMNWYTGSTPERVYAEGVRKRLAHLGVDDSVFAILRYRNGVLATLENSWALPKTQTQVRSNTLDKGMEVVGTKGMLSIQAHNLGVVLQTEVDISYSDIMYAPPVQGISVGIYKEEMEHFLRCIIADKEPATNADLALEALKIACAIDRSCASKAPVTL